MTPSPAPTSCTLPATPSSTTTAPGTAGLRLTDPRAQALLHILLIFRLHPGGFLDKDLRSLLGEYLGRPPHGPGSITPSQATYDLRRLRQHGLIERIPHTHRYQVTTKKWSVSVLWTPNQAPSTHRIRPTSEFAFLKCQVSERRTPPQPDQDRCLIELNTSKSLSLPAMRMGGYG